MKSVNVLLSAYNYQGCGIGNCKHYFCLECFKNECHISKLARCPCCQCDLYAFIQTFDEAVCLGKGAYVNYCAMYEDSQSLCKDSMHKTCTRVALSHFQDAINMNSLNLVALFCLATSSHYCFKYCDELQLTIDLTQDYQKSIDIMIEMKTYINNIYECCPILLKNQSKCKGINTDTLYTMLGDIFMYNNNHPTALYYYKKAYEQCLRSSDHTTLTQCKQRYMASKDRMSKEPALRFAVGDEVEFLIESDCNLFVEWKMCKIVELSYRERHFEHFYNAPYRVEVCDSTDDAYPNQLPVYAVADLDRYIRKEGVRAIEDTRYQTMLDDKVAELARVYCSKEFVTDIFTAFSRDPECSDMLDLSACKLYTYRMLIMHRHPLVFTHSGYHIPTTKEIITGTRDFFDPVNEGTDYLAFMLGDTIQVHAIDVITLQNSLLGVNRNFGLTSEEPFGQLDQLFTWLLATYIDIFSQRDTNSKSFLSLIKCGFSTRVVRLPQSHAPTLVRPTPSVESGYP